MAPANLKIAVIGLHYAPESTGNAPYTAGLAEGLAAAGHEVEVITGYPHYPEWLLQDGHGEWSRVEEINQIMVKRLRHYVPARPGIIGRLHLELSFGLRLLFTRWGRPDVVLLVSPALFSTGLALCRARMSRRRPAVGIWVQDLYSRGVVETGTATGGVARLLGKLESAILRSADGVVAIHQRFADYLVDSLNVSARKVKVIRNWTHLPDVLYRDRSQTRLELGWGSDEIIVLHAGNMGAKQGLENVIEAGRISDTLNGTVRFVLMGDGNQRAKLEESGRDIEHVQFIDPLPTQQFQATLGAADILLVNELPGVRDMAVPSKLTSYFSSGVPVLAATDIGSVTAAEISASGGGIRVDAGDPRALFDAAQALANDKAKSLALAQSGLQFRHDVLSSTAAIDRYDDFVNGMIAARSRQGQRHSP